MKRNIDTFIKDLLHIDSVNSNKLLDLTSSKDKVFYLYSDRRECNAEDILGIIGARIGKIGNTVLRKSALMGEQQIGTGNALDWDDGSGEADARGLDSFVKDVYKELDLKGNNPLFLSVGAISWRLATSMTGANAQLKDVKTPLLIFPIRLIRSVATRPMTIEFVDDSIYINPCLIAKLSQIYGEEILKDFPHPSGAADLNTPVPGELIESLGGYLTAVEGYVNACRGNSETLFEFDRNTVAIARYNHDEICMYYDIQRNKEKIYSSPLVERVFTISTDGTSIPEVLSAPRVSPMILDYDSNQERMINRVLSGESIIIKGPPGTGKTLTIANMIAALLSEGKRVMLVSKKLAALSEVYKKLPDELRDFLMLLDCETEAQAANLSPSKVKAGFSALLRACGAEPKNTSALFEDRAHLLELRSSALKMLASYFEETFSEEKLGILGYSYYEALNKLLENEDIETVEYTAPEIARALTREQFNELKSIISDAGTNLRAMCGKDGKEHSPLLCPYYTFSSSIKNEEEALARNEELKQLAAEIRDESRRSDFPIDGFRLRHLTTLISSDITEEDLKAVREAPERILSSLPDALDRAKGINTEIFKRVGIPEEADISDILAELKSVSLDGSLTSSELTAIKENEKILSLINGSSEAAISSSLKKAEELEKRRLEHSEEMRTVFKAELTEDELTRIDSAYKALASYVDSNLDAPKFLDFSAKKAWTSLSTLSYLSSPSFKEIVAATDWRHSALLLEDQIKNEAEQLSRIFKAALNENERSAVALVMKKSGASGIPAYAYVKAVLKDYDVIKKVFDNISVSEDVNVAELVLAFEAKNSLSDLASLTKEIDIKAPSSIKDSRPSSLLKAEKILAIKDYLGHKAIIGASDSEVAEAISRIASESARMVGLIDELLGKLDSFGKNIYSSYYTEFTDRILFSDLDVFISEASDRNLLSSSVKYIAIRSVDSLLSPAAFFRPFESGRRAIPKESFEVIFEHSTIDLAVKAAMSSLKLRNGRGRSIEEAISRFSESDEKIRALNAKLIRNSLVKRIDTADKDFAFLNSENDSLTNLRRLFKNHASAIVKLKNCFLLSPSTVSVLFTAPELSDFDTVIVDEASQLEPTAILPILVRCRQCVFVGDEYQMPPIAHFTPKSDHTVRVAGVDDVILPPETSLLSLAIQSNHFNVEKLGCHFRSRTESLIAFSQKRFYPFMRTFPASLPKAEGLGFKDIYIPDGESSAGKNDREARAVIRALNDHFDRYFDSESGKLSESVGVVAFGESQLELIKKYVNENTELKKKIDTAINSFDDIPEKLVFFKTVETVQGQETEHLILSFTYAGTNNFGDLSRRSIGECIFNVAVTRARSSITMIHSILPTETSNETVRDFLEISSRFSDDSGLQFIPGEEPSGFIRSVRKYLIENLGIPEERIVVNCGATDGSIRIPIVILSEDKSEAKLGIFCELPYRAENYLDETVRYYNILKSRGWNLYRIAIHDWIDNRDFERNALSDVVRKHL